MFLRLRNLSLLFAIGFLILTTNVTSAQAWKPLIGYTELVAEKGGALEDGTGIIVMQTEARYTVYERNPDGSFVLDSNGNQIPIGIKYMPNPSTPPEPQFSGKTFTDATGTNFVDMTGNNVVDEYSSHARSVGLNFFGNTNSMTPGITNITGYEANDYLGNVLGFNTGNDPAVTAAYDVGNHSYIGNGLTTAQAEDLLERFDFVINRDNTVMVVGANNGSANATPQLLAPSFNSITVGRSDGGHSQTLTSVYGAPRFAVQLVVPSAGATSFSTPVVASAAGLLRDAGSGTNFVQNEVVRATLFAGATKSEFSTWDRTETRPLDEVFGFGELNILNSYHIFEGGEFEGSTSDPSANVGLMGWDYGDFDGTNDLYYDFSIDPAMVGEVSAVLSWNMEITDTNSGPGFEASRSLADLNLDLFDSTGSFLGSMLDSSNGTDYNNEHIYFQNLSSGDYTFRVSGDLATDFGFSWMVVTSVPEPSSLSVLGLLSLGVLTRRRRGLAV